MIEISEKGKGDHEPNHPDLLSNLPLSIIHYILSLIPIREAVKTCILASQWRYTWVTIPHLVFEEDRPLQISQYQFGKCMENFITNVLLRHEGPIFKFAMSVRFEPSFRIMDQWLICLSRNDIRELIIDMGYAEDSYCKLHSSIYLCKKLTYLRLYNCVLDPPPSTFKGFLFLRGLHLRDAFSRELSPEGFESVFANSPLLQKLDLIYSGTSPFCNSSELRIDAPNLKYMFARGEYRKMRVYAPLLADMTIELGDNNFTPDYIQEDESVCNYTCFLAGFANLEKLSIDSYAMKYLCGDIVPLHRPLVFARLKFIQLGGVNFRNIRDALVVALLVAGAPNLERLEVDSDDFMDTDFPNLKAKKVSFMDIRSALNCRFEKLRVVKFDWVSGHLLEMEFIKYLLENSPVLQVISIGMYYLLADEDREILRDVLLSSPCASPVAKITCL